MASTSAAYELQPDPRRWYERVAVHCPVTLTCRGRIWETELRDLSANGCRLLRPEGCDLGIDDLVHVQVLDPATPIDAQPLTGRIARISERHIGIGFQSEDDPNRFGE